MSRPPPKISVICIFYNAEKYFVEAIESVLAQSFEDLELILADDGSTDSSTSIAKSYADRDPRVRHVQHPGHVNHGMSATRNLGLAAAQGEFIAFMDADDVWERSKLEDQLAVFDVYPEPAMVCGAVRYWRSWCGSVDVVIPTDPAVDRPLAPTSVFQSIYPLGTAAAPCPSGRRHGSTRAQASARKVSSADTARRTPSCSVRSITAQPAEARRGLRAVLAGARTRTAADGSGSI